MLPTIVGHLAIGYMTLDAQPSVAERQYPIFGQRQPYLRHRARIDAQRLRAAAQPVIFQFHRLFLAAYGQHTVQPSQFGISLLDNGFARKMVGSGHVQSVANPPSTGRIGGKRAYQTCPHISVAVLQRAQSVFIGIEPQRCLVLRYRSLRLQLIGKPLCQVLFAGFGTILPRILGMGSRQPRGQCQCYDCPFHVYIY